MAFPPKKKQNKMAPKVSLVTPTIALPQTDKPNLEGAAVIPEGIVNPPQGLALSRRGAAQVLLEMQ